MDTKRWGMNPRHWGMNPRHWGMDAESRLFFRREARYLSCVALLAFVVHCALVTGRFTVLVGSEHLRAAPERIRVGAAMVGSSAAEVQKAVKALCRW